MKFAIAAAAVLGLAACAGPQTSNEEQKSVADSRFDYAANFTCDGGGKLDVVFHQDNGGVLARMDGGAPVTLALGDDGTWSSGTTTLAMAGPGATWTADGKPASCAFESRSLPPPKVDGVTQSVVAADAGKTFTVKVGEKIAVALSGVPTAGYVWGASNPPAFVKASDGPGGSTSTSQYLPGFVGGSHWEVVIIEAVAAGEGEITLAQRRPWESAAEPDASTFKFMLKAS
jgi:predicted secreted protein